jgi:hypothetical protein
VELPLQLRKIAYGAFGYCRMLEMVDISSSNIEVEENAFLRCTEIQEVYVESRAQFDTISFENKYANPLVYGAKLCEWEA